MQSFKGFQNIVSVKNYKVVENKNRFNLEDVPYPVNAVIDISSKITLAFKVTNHAGHENRSVFYGFKIREIESIRIIVHDTNISKNRRIT